MCCEPLYHARAWRPAKPDVFQHTFQLLIITGTNGFSSGEEKLALYLHSLIRTLSLILWPLLRIDFVCKIRTQLCEGFFVGHYYCQIVVVLNWVIKNELGDIGVVLFLSHNKSFGKMHHLMTVHLIRHHPLTWWSIRERYCYWGTPQVSDTPSKRCIWNASHIVKKQPYELISLQSFSDCNRNSSLPLHLSSGVRSWRG